MADIVDVPVIDAHHHLARLGIGYPWLSAESPIDRYHGDDRSLRQDYTVADYRRDMIDVPLIASVHVENGAADPLREAEWLGEVIARDAPTPSVHIARADLDSPGALALLEQYAVMPHVRGVRHILNWHPDPRASHTPRPGIIDEPMWRGNFRHLSVLGLSFDLQVFADQLGDAARLAADHPETTIILDHAGMPLHRDPDYLAMWRHGLEQIAHHDNVTVKISALGTTDHEWTPARIASLVDRTIQTFGPDRVMFASNFPVDGLYSSLSHLYRAFSMLAADYTPSERADMFGRTAARVYRMEVPGL